MSAPAREPRPDALSQASIKELSDAAIGVKRIRDSNTDLDPTSKTPRSDGNLAKPKSLQQQQHQQPPPQQQHQQQQQRIPIMFVSSPPAVISPGTPTSSARIYIAQAAPQTATSTPPSMLYLTAPAASALVSSGTAATIPAQVPAAASAKSAAVAGIGGWMSVELARLGRALVLHGANLNEVAASLGGQRTAAQVKLAFQALGGTRGPLRFYLQEHIRRRALFAAAPTAASASTTTTTTTTTAAAATASLSTAMTGTTTSSGPPSVAAVSLSASSPAVPLSASSRVSQEPRGLASDELPIDLTEEEAAEVRAGHPDPRLPHLPPLWAVPAAGSVPPGAPPLHASGELLPQPPAPGTPFAAAMGQQATVAVGTGAATGGELREARLEEAGPEERAGLRRRVEAILAANQRGSFVCEPSQEEMPLPLRRFARRPQPRPVPSPDSPVARPHAPAPPLASSPALASAASVPSTTTTTSSSSSSSSAASKPAATLASPGGMEARAGAVGASRPAGPVAGGGAWRDSLPLALAQKLGLVQPSAAPAAGAVPSAVSPAASPRHPLAFSMPTAPLSAASVPPPASASVSAPQLALPKPPPALLPTTSPHSPTTGATGNATSPTSSTQPPV